MEKILDWLDFTSSPPAIVLIAQSLIVLFAVLSGLLMSFIMINRIRLHYGERRDERLIAAYENEIFEILIGEQKRNDPRGYRYTVYRLRIAFSGTAIKALLETLVLLGRDLSGENASLLHELYQDLRLDQRALTILAEGPWHQKILAVKELGHFHVTHALPHLSELSEDPNPTLRTEAQCALLRLGGASRLDFLATLDQPLTRWQQMRITQILKGFDQDKLPDFHTYLTNPNEAVTLFVLKLIRVYNQTQARDKVVEKLFDPRLSIQRESIITVSNWLDQEVVDLLIALYNHGELTLHVPVVQSLRQWIYDKNTRTFLESVAQAADDYTLRMSALQSLKHLGGKEAIAPLNANFDEVGQRCIAHQLDDRI